MRGGELPERFECLCSKVFGTDKPSGQYAWVAPASGILAALGVSIMWQFPLLTFAAVLPRTPLVWTVLGAARAPVVWVVAALVASLVHMLMGRPGARPAREMAFATVAAGAWSVPLLMLLDRRSIYAIPTALILAGFAVRAVWPSIPRTRLPDPVSLAPPMIAAVLGQCAVLALGAGLWPRSIAFWLAAGAIVAWRYNAADPELRPKPVTGRRLVLRLASVIFTTFAIIMSRGLFWGGSGGGDGAGRGTRGGDTVRDVYSGVIIVPESRRHVTLMPPIPSIGRNPFAGRFQSNLSIPFFGVYWLLRPGRTMPPRDAVTLRGDPSATTYKTTDLANLNMSARQNLERSLDVSCCGGIRVEVLNAERRPETVMLELVLADTTSSPRSEVSLGFAMLQAHRNWQLHADPDPVLETLSFPMLQHGPLRQFDELVLVFHLANPRWHRSARVAVERFILVPRRTAI